MFIEMFLNNYNDRHLAEFARNCGYELDKYTICEDCIKVSLTKPFEKYNLTYKLYDYHIEELGGYQPMCNTTNLPMVQKEWRKYLKSKFGNFYVAHFNDWLDHQKLTYEKGNRR